jgi:hypothetical protein
MYIVFDVAKSVGMITSLTARTPLLSVKQVQFEPLLVVTHNPPEAAPTQYVLLSVG